MVKTIVEINDEVIKCECLRFSHIWSDDNITLKFIFKEVPDIIFKFGYSGTLIDSVKVYHEGQKIYKEYFPKYTHVIVDKIREEKFSPCIVYMSALRLEQPSNYNAKRICVGPACDYPISYLSVMMQLMDIVGEETAELIWESEMVVFYCCKCFQMSRVNLDNL